MTNFTKCTSGGICKAACNLPFLLLPVFSIPATAAEPWQPLYNNKNLKNWQIVSQEPFVYHGKVSIDGDQLRLRAGQPGTGIRYLKPVHRSNYEIRVEARREEGFDFFCGLTFPVGSNYCTFVAGGWDGDVTGLSNIDGRSAAENETTRSIAYEQGRWYRFHIRVTPDRIVVRMDDRPLIDLAIRDKKLGIRATMQPLIPLGISTWYTQAGLRRFEVRPITNE